MELLRIELLSEDSTERGSTITYSDSRRGKLILDALLAARAEGLPQSPPVLPQRPSKPRKEPWGHILLFLLLSPFSALYMAFVFTRLWTWFVVPPFGAPRLSLAYAYGITLVFGVLILGVLSSLSLIEERTKSLDDPNSPKGLLYKFLIAPVFLSLIWGMGALVALFT